MNQFPLALTTLSIPLLALSLWAKSALRKNKLSRTLFPLALIYNFSFGCLHLYIFETGRTPITGALNDFISGGLSLVIALGYAYAIPWQWLSEPKLAVDWPESTTKNRVSTAAAIEKLLHSLKITLVILATAFFYSVMLIALASQIIPLDGIEDTYYAIGCAAFYLLLVSIGVTLYKVRSRTTTHDTSEQNHD